MKTFYVMFVFRKVTSVSSKYFILMSLLPIESFFLNFLRRLVFFSLLLFLCQVTHYKRTFKINLDYKRNICNVNTRWIDINSHFMHFTPFRLLNGPLVINNSRNSPPNTSKNQQLSFITVHTLKLYCHSLQKKRTTAKNN